MRYIITIHISFDVYGGAYATKTGTLFALAAGDNQWCLCIVCTQSHGNVVAPKMWLYQCITTGTKVVWQAMQCTAGARSRRK